MTAPTRLSLAFLSLLAIGACSRPPEDLTALEDELMEAKSKLGKERKTISGLRDELLRASDSGDTTQSTIGGLAKEKEGYDSELQTLVDQFMVYRNDYRENIRKRAPGMALEDFEALGRKFSNVVVKSVDDWELAFKHASGMVRLNLADAPPEIRIMFAYNPSVGPKPLPVVAVASPPAGGLAAASSGDSEEVLSSGSTMPLDDPFSRPPSGQTVGSALGLDPEEYRAQQAAAAAQRAKQPKSKTRIIKFKDGSSVEVVADWSH